MNRNIIIGGIVIGAVLITAFSGTNIEDISNALPKNPNVPPYPDRNLSAVDTIVIHHAAVASNLAGSTPEGVARFHIQQYNWPGIGYHLVVMPDGKIYLVNPLVKLGSHTGALNPTSIGILVMGNFDVEDFTQKQQAALENAIRWVKRQIGRKLKVRPHNNYANKTCPGYNIDLKLSEVIQNTGML